MKYRVLSVEDKPATRQNFKAWMPRELGDDTVELTLAATTEEACAVLHRTHFHLVLLDLSMDLHDQRNRGNAGIQRYLSKKPDQTRYAIVSGTAQVDEVADAAFDNEASGFLNKSKVDKFSLAELLEKALAGHPGTPAAYAREARETLMSTDDAQLLESRILEALRPRGMARHLKGLLERPLRSYGPIALPKDESAFAVQGPVVCAHFWSRAKGHPGSVVFFNGDVPQHDAVQVLASWLDSELPEEPAHVHSKHGVIALSFDGPEGDPDAYDLPVIPKS